MSDYTYRMTDIVTYDEESAYAIEFEQRENVELPFFKGLYISIQLIMESLMLNLKSIRS